MRARRIAVVAAAAAVVAGGAGAAIGATSDDKAKETEAKILAQAAKTLNTTPEKLRDALADAEDAQLDQAVKDGDLTQAQADAIKKRRQESGRVLGIPHGGPGFGPHGPGERGMRFRRGPGPIMDLADALGITERQLFNRLRSGRSIAEIAKAEGKSMADVKASVKAAGKKRLDAAVKAGRITQAQADEILSHIDERLDHLGERGLRFRGGPRHGPIGDLADALGITERQLFTRLRSGETVAEIAKAEGKTLADVKASLKAAEKKRLDAAVKAGRITQAQADEMLSHIDEMLEHLGERAFHRGPHPGPPPPPPDSP